MTKLKLKDLPLKNKRVLMRVDFNTPVEKGQITDDSKIRASLPSIRYILEEGASLILMSHLGRPDGKPSSEFSLSPCAKRLSELLRKPVKMAKDCIGSETGKLKENLQPNEVLLLENLRFHPGEEEPEKHPDFVANLASFADYYVNDAFGTAHRAHASTASITKYFPKTSAMGFLMQKEIEALSFLLEKPEKPFYAIIGGAKVSSKLKLLKKLSTLVDGLFIGGGMSFTFFKAQNISTGNSPCEDPKIVQDIAKNKLHLPIDLVIADSFSNEAKIKTIQVEEGVAPGWQGMDIGPKTILDWSKKLEKGATIFWNGPLGVFEMANFAKGTREIAEILANSQAKTVIGGGDSVAAIQQTGLAKEFFHLSTGGGAALEFLELGHLPGIDALSENT
jgi:phosphoglycerate kinase